MIVDRKKNNSFIYTNLNPFLTGTSLAAFIQRRRKFLEVLRNNFAILKREIVRLGMSDTPIRVTDFSKLGNKPACRLRQIITRRNTSPLLKKRPRYITTKATMSFNMSRWQFGSFASNISSRHSILP